MGWKRVLAMPQWAMAHSGSASLISWKAPWASAIHHVMHQGHRPVEVLADPRRRR
jgi:hypothetical protein